MDNFSPLEPVAPEKPFPWLAVIGGVTFFVLLIVGTLYFFVPGFNPLSIVGVGQEQPTDTSESRYTELYVIGVVRTADLRDAQEFVKSVGGEISYSLSRTHSIVARISEDEKAELEADPRILWVERQQILERQQIPVSLMAQASGATRTSSGVDVFIIDSGAGNVPGLTYKSKTGLSILDESGQLVPMNPDDTDGHGTKAAYSFQTYLKDTNDINLHSIKDGEEFPVIDLTAEAIYVAIESGAEVINLSTASFSGDSMVFNEALNAAKAAGVVVIISAGNEGGKKGENYLTQDPYVISVGALNSDGTVADYSDGLVQGDEADIFALGTVSLPGEETAQGTSFAAPRVTAAVAQIMAQSVSPTFDADNDGRWDPEEVRRRLKDGVRKGEFPAMRDGEEVLAMVNATPSMAGGSGSGVTSTPVTGGTGGTTGTIGGGGPTVGGGTVFGGNTTFGDDTVYGVDGGSSESSGSIAQTPRSSSGSGGSVSPSQSSLVQTQNANTFPQDEGPSGLVPCGDAGEAPCQVCHVETLARDTLKLVIYVAVFIATLMIAYAGFKMVTAQGDVGAVTEAKNIFLKVILGLVLVLTAWLIVDTLMRVFLRGSFGAWNDFGDCIAQPVGTLTGNAPPEETGGTGVGSPQNPFVSTGKKGGDAENRTLLNELGIPVNKTCNQGTCLEGTDQNLLRTLGEIKTSTGEKYTLTGGTENVHQNICHTGGSCVDVVCTTCGDDSAKINKFIQAAQSKGYCAVYEPGPGNTCPAGVRPCLTGVGTGKHFSLYMSPTQSPSCKL